VRDVLLSHREHFQAEGITSTFVVEPEAESRVTVTLVRGMIVQIMENLISNSVYWLRQAKRLDPDFSPRIEVVLDTQGREIRFSDNGPGISAEDAPKVFDAFFTNRPAGGGKGLGLFISREIAKYHGAGLDLVPGDDGVLRTFVVSFEGVR
jgi:signal transduction histidine kinase